LIPAIRLQHVSKQYRHALAVRDLTLDVAPAEVFGFLGLNGAGKTTTIRILLDLVRPTAGSAEVFGVSCREQGLEARGSIGYLPGELGFYGDMSGEATLRLLARLGTRPVDPARQLQLLDRLQFSRRDLSRSIREYSTGMKRKLGIVQAFQADAPLLILDEPTEGLDPLMQDAFYDLLAETKAAGRTVFMSSHILSEVERVCDRIAVIRRGALVLSSTVTDVRGMADRRVRLLFRGDVAFDPGAPGAGLPSGCSLTSREPRAWALQVRGPLGPLLAFAARFNLEDVEVSEPHLDAVLKPYYSDKGRAE
jgi:ABC-2 type transport system ATP-binding protein